MSFKLKLWIVLMFIGLLGVASMLFSHFPLDNLPPEVTAVISPETMRWVMLINPSFLVLVMVTVGIFTYEKAGLHAPMIEGLLQRDRSIEYSATTIITQGLSLGISAGVLILVIARFFEPHLPPELVEAEKNMDLSLATKVLYGGITEEILTRFGLLSLFAWMLFKLTKKVNTALYWTATFMAAVLFAAGHLPMVFQLMPEPTAAVYAYIFLGNGVAGMIFGYAYWKRGLGLECAMIAHAVAHLTMFAFTLITT